MTEVRCVLDAKAQLGECPVWSAVDELSATVNTSAGQRKLLTEQENAWLIAPEFVAGVNNHRAPEVPGWPVLPTMRVLHRAQEIWDRKHGTQALPGRPVPEPAPRPNPDPVVAR